MKLAIQAKPTDQIKIATQYDRQSTSLVDRSKLC